MIYYAIFIAGFLATLGFFNYHNMLPESIVKAIFYLITAGGLLLAATDRSTSFRQSDRKSVV